MAVIRVICKPKSKTNRVVPLNPNTVKVHTTQSAIKGQANKSIITLLSNFYSVSPNHIFIQSGHTSRVKTIMIL